MAKKRPRFEPDADGILRTGIYQQRVRRRERTEAEKRADADACWEMLTRERPTIRQWFHTWRGYLAEWIRPHAEHHEQPRPNTEYHAIDLGDGYNWYALPSDAPLEVLDAVDAMNEIRCLEHHIGGNDDLTPHGELAFVVNCAYKLGRITERLQIRPFEPLVSSAKEVRQGASRGAAVTNADHIELQPGYQIEIDRLMKNGAADGLSYSQAINEVVRLTGASRATIARHTTNKWPRKGGRPRKPISPPPG